MAGQTVVVSVLADTKKFANSMNSIGDSTNKFTSGMKKLGGAAVAAAGIAGVAIGGFAVSAIKSASDLEQSIGGVDAVFKENAETVHKWAKSADTALGLSENSYNELATVIGSQLKNMGVATEEVAVQTNDLIGMGADLAAQFGGSTSDAVSALSSLLRGERDPIERYGVSINEAAVKAKMAEMGLEGLSGEAEKNAKLQATLALLTDQTADSQGAFARESETLAGVMQRLGARFQNLKDSIGTALLPTITALGVKVGELWDELEKNGTIDAMITRLEKLSDSMVAWIEKIDVAKLAAGDFEGAFPPILDLFKGFNEAGGNVGGIFESLGGVLGGLAGSILPALVPALQQVGDAIVAIVQDNPDMLPDLFNLLAEAITTVLPVLPDLIEAAIQLAEAILPILPPLIELIQFVLPGLVWIIEKTVLPTFHSIRALLELVTGDFEGWVDAMEAMSPGFKKQFDDWKKWVEDMTRGIAINVAKAIQWFQDLVVKVVAVFYNARSWLINAGANIINGLRNGLNSAITNVWNFLRNIPTNVKNFFAGAASWLYSAGSNLISGFINGIGGAAQWLYNTIRNVVGNVVDFAKRLLGINSPSKVFKQIGKWTVEGLEDGLSGPNSLNSIMNGLSNQVTDGFDASLNVSGSKGRGFGNNYEITVQTGIGDPIEIGRQIKETINDYERFGGVR